MSDAKSNVNQSLSQWSEPQSTYTHQSKPSNTQSDESDDQSCSSNPPCNAQSHSSNTLTQSRSSNEPYSHVQIRSPTIQSQSSPSCVEVQSFNTPSHSGQSDFSKSDTQSQSSHPLNDDPQTQTSHDLPGEKSDHGLVSHDTSLYQGPLLSTQSSGTLLSPSVEKENHHTKWMIVTAVLVLFLATIVAAVLLWK